MNPNLYIIKGNPNCGKTATCWKLLHLLKQHVVCYNYWELFTFHHSVTYNDDEEKQCYEYLDLKSQQRDIVDFITIVHLGPNKSNSKVATNSKVAIISAGDDPFYVKRAIYKALGENAHYIVCCEHLEDEPETTNRILHDEFDISLMKEYSLEKQCNDNEEQRIAEEIYNQLLTDLGLKK